MVSSLFWELAQAQRWALRILESREQSIGGTLEQQSEGALRRQVLRLKKERAKWCLNIYILSAGKERKHQRVESQTQD